VPFRHFTQQNTQAHRTEHLRSPEKKVFDNSDMSAYDKRNAFYAWNRMIPERRNREHRGGTDMPGQA